MKLCITGAGSSRLPLMMASVTKAAETFPVDEVALFDIRPDRVNALFKVGMELAAHLGSPPRFVVHQTFESAVEGAGALILTIRPGFEERRAADERHCLNMGVLGQETTGPAGFAFATRTIPAVSGYCAVAERLAPGFLPVIFTNPAGMVTQALHDLGFSRAIGICDSATEAIKKAAEFAGTDIDHVDFEVSGLNHLSWARRITGPDGSDILARVLADDRFLSKAVPWRRKETALEGRIPVEYLYYFLRAREALESILAEPCTRGEALMAANGRLFEDLRGLDVGAATIRYARYLFNRNDTYMAYALGHRHGFDGPSDVPGALSYLENQIGGYAEVAMELLAGSTGPGSAESRPRIMALNVRNGGSIPELAQDDVIESDCIVNADGVSPRKHGPMPAADLELVGRVKEYERLAVGSILSTMRGDFESARAMASDALTAHPLVPDRRTAVKLVDTLITPA